MVNVMEQNQPAPIARTRTASVATGLETKERVLPAVDLSLLIKLCRLPLRVALELQTSRIDQLCRFIRENGLQPPPMPPEKDQALRKVLETLELVEVGSTSAQHEKCAKDGLAGAISRNAPSCVLPPSTAVTDDGPEGAEIQNSRCHSHELEAVEASQPQNLSTLPATVVTEPDNETFAVATGPQDVRESSPRTSPGGWDWNIWLGSPSMQAQNVAGTSLLRSGLPTNVAEVPEQHDPLLAEDTSDPESIEELIDQLSDRVGTLQIGPGGQTHFYGPTSTFNLAGMLVSDKLILHRTIRSEGQQCLDHLGINQEIPAALEEHLINLYFTWQDPAFHVVDRQTYEDAKAKWHCETEDTPFYSEVLRNAMCCLGAAFETRYHPTFITFPKSLADFFGDRAKALLEIELDSPCVATVQAMVILSNHDIGNKRDARGWLYSVMAIRLAFDLALHLDMSPYIAKGVITAADAELRRTVFWAAYTIDHLWGFYLGRPFRTNMDDVTVSKPSDDGNQGTPNEWRPYVSLISTEAPPVLSNCMETVSRYHVLLCEIMEPCGYILYGTSGFSKCMLQEMNANIVAKLLNWKSNLPAILQVNLSDSVSLYLPHVLLLHMQYHQNIIHAHRPWMSKSYLQPYPPQGPGYLHAREMCVESAISIAKILGLYEASYTLRRINIHGVFITTSAALLLLFATVLRYKPHDDDNIALHLSVCFRALDEFSLSWETAKRSKDFLMRLQRHWEILTHSTKSLRRSEAWLEKQTSCAPRKRSRTSGGLDSGSSSDDQRPLGVRPQLDNNINMDIDLDWMLMPDVQALFENRDGNLYPE
ncbi:hypothetical protein B7463_g2477, partial [Scytalidium lignicola]